MDKKFGKDFIENCLVKDICKFLEKYKVNQDVCIYAIGKRWCWTHQVGHKKLQLVCEENLHPYEYFEYYNTKHILSMSFEGPLYDIINYSGGAVYSELYEMLDRYGLYFELGNDWNLSCFLRDDNYEDWEFTDYEQTKLANQEEYLYGETLDKYPILKKIWETWYKLSEGTGDKGSCVLGAGFHFTFNGKKMFLPAASPWQGEGSWTPHRYFTKDWLTVVGCQNISYDCGCLD